MNFLNPMNFFGQRIGVRRPEGVVPIFFIGTGMKWSDAERGAEKEARLVHMLFLSMAPNTRS